MNAHYGRGRKLKRQPQTHSFEEQATGEERELPVVVPRILDSLGVRQGLDRLTEEHRAVLMLGVVEGLSCREMAAVLDVPIGTVMSRISRARRALREQLETRAAPARPEVVDIGARRLREV
jgi:RNA polymerase sigma-70 factor (ECF subfamily)